LTTRGRHTHFAGLACNLAAQNEHASRALRLKIFLRRTTSKFRAAPQLRASAKSLDT
jgi:hypothetical protein